MTDRTFKYPIFPNIHGHLIDQDRQLVTADDVNALARRGSIWKDLAEAHLATALEQCTKLKELRTENARLSKGWDESTASHAKTIERTNAQISDLRIELSHKDRELTTAKAAQRSQYTYACKRDEELKTIRDDLDIARNLAVQRGELLEQREQTIREVSAELKTAHRATWDTQTSLDRVADMHKNAVGELEKLKAAHNSAWDEIAKRGAEILELRNDKAATPRADCTDANKYLRAENTRLEKIASTTVLGQHKLREAVKDLMEAVPEYSALYRAAETTLKETE